jgi:hypothetical protein
MAGGNLFARVLSYVVNEILVEGLANKYANLFPQVCQPISSRSPPSSLPHK